MIKILCLTGRNVNRTAEFSLHKDMRHIRITLQYDGTDFSGWQVQARGTTIQGLIEEALFEITGERTRVTGAARTDAGVHAIEQVASFKTLSLLEPGVFRKAFNARLVGGIRVVHAIECPPGFHPRYDATGKTYSYLISRQGAYSPFLGRFSWGVPYPLNTALMQEAADHLVGTHDFSCFRASGCSSRHPVRTVSSLQVCDLAGVEFISFRFETPVVKVTMKANAFLRHMARNIAGTLVDIGREQYPPLRMKEILEAKDRRQAGRTAPACGLFLEKVEY